LATLENSFSQYPKHEGRFAQFSGLCVKWDAQKPAGSRVVSVSVGDVAENKLSPLIMNKTYKIATKTYMIEGRDGYDSLQNVKVLVDRENGKLLSHLIRTHLLKQKTLKVLKSDSSMVNLFKERLLHKDHEQQMLPGIHCGVEGRIVRVDQ
jgi:2',3'-cyclic-nucleotide 2'-phosphodiesterase (5'-nucleotidase family)